MRDAPLPVVLDGVCHAFFAFDVGREIDLDAAARVLGAQRTPPVGGSRQPFLRFDKAPVRCRLPLAPVEVEGLAPCREAEVVLHDFGGVSVELRVAAAGPPPALAAVAAALGSAETTQAAARALVEEVVRRLGSAIEAPRVAEDVEEYLVFHAAAATAPVPPSVWAETYAPAMAAVLRGEPRTLSEQEIAQTLASRVSFTPDDLVLIDWNAALVVRERAEDVLAVLSFANLQLLEMRWLDARLSAALESAYDAVRRRSRLALLRPGADRGELEEIARRQLDAALLFEHVRNAPKLLGDQYLARVYEHASRRFRLADWDDAIHRKLDVLRGVYERLRDRSAATRSEALEWIIIALIFFEIVLTLAGSR